MPDQMTAHATAISVAVVFALACGGADEHEGTAGSCDTELGTFGIVGTRRIDDEIGEIEGTWFQSPGLGITGTGLLAVFVSEDIDGEDRRSYAVPLAFDGTPTAPASVLPALGDAYHAAMQGPAGLWVAYCRDEQVGWIVLDDAGALVGAAMSPTELPGCSSTPSLARVDEDEVLIAWVDQTPDSACRSCVLLATAAVSGVTSMRSLPEGSAGSWSGAGVTVGSQSAVVTTVRNFDFEERAELVTTLISLAGEPLADPLVVELLPSSSGDDPGYLTAAAIANDDGGFFVYVGGYGPSWGRMRLDASGAVIEAFAEQPLFDRLAAYAVYETRFGIASRPGGWLAHGNAVVRTNLQTVLTALNPAAEPISHIELPGLAAAVADDGERTWVLHDNQGGGLEISELGCRR